MVQLGRIQIEDPFTHHRRKPLDDSEFIALLDSLIESFARAGLSALRVKERSRHTCESYHRCCQEAKPGFTSTFEANLEHRFCHLPRSNRRH